MSSVVITETCWSVMRAACRCSSSSDVIHLQTIAVGQETTDRTSASITPPSRGMSDAGGVTSLSPLSMSV